jgi:tRNA(fMet)-specific endonuclease VapC
MRYFLDTDSVTHLHIGTPSIVKRASSVGEANFGTTVVSRIEILFGRFESLFKAENAERLLIALERLERSELFLNQMTVVTFDEDAAFEFDRLRKHKKLKKIGRGDLLIACIVLANRGTLVTRNLKDFKLIPTLKLENWID